MTVATIYGDVADGWPYVANAGSYVNAWNAPDADETADIDEWINVYQSFDGTYYTIGRGFLFFDTSAIPVGATINSVTLKIVLMFDGTATIIQNGQPTYPHKPLVTGDYNKANYDGNGGTKDFTGLDTYVYLDFPLNATGMSWINAGGWTKLCLRTLNDVNGIAPLAYEDVGTFCSAESAYPPYLEITYSEPAISSGIWIEGTAFKYFDSTGTERSIVGDLV